MKVRIAEVYMNAKSFADEANKTIGAPAITEEVILNRRKVTGRLTEIGEINKQKVIDYFKTNYSIDVKLKWNVKCGCSSCPCSPGFDVMVEETAISSAWIFRGRGKGCLRVNIWFEDCGDMKVREPKTNYIKAA